MANRNFANGGKIYSMNVMPVLISGKITIGASGAVSAFSGATVKSVVKTSTGIYTITFQDNYASALAVIGSVESPVSGLSGIMQTEIGNASSTSIQTLAGGTVVIKTLDVTGALANPASGSAIKFVVIANNSKVPTQFP